MNILKTNSLRSFQENLYYKKGRCKDEFLTGQLISSFDLYKWEILIQNKSRQIDKI